MFDRVTFDPKIMGARPWITRLCAVLLAVSAHTAHAGINVWTSHGPDGGGIEAGAIDRATSRTLGAGSAGRDVFDFEPASSGPCAGDCDGGGEVTVNELITLVNIALGTGGSCLNGVPAGAPVEVTLIIHAVNNALTGCPALPPTPTATPAVVTQTPTKTPTPAPTPTYTSTPAPSTFRALAATMESARSDHRATVLPNGQVLLIGGNLLAPSFGTISTVVEYYDPARSTFATSSPWRPAREGHTATLLGDGTVLITGGFTDDSEDLDTAEVYDPATNRFTALAATMSARRTNHTATLLVDGKILIAGGAFHSGSAQDSAELYDPAANTFTALSATMTSARFFHAAAPLRDGRVLVTGGFVGQSMSSYAALNTAELYDPVTQTFAPLTGRMISARAAHTATALPDGHVFLAGGINDINGAALNSAELYGP